MRIERKSKVSWNLFVVKRFVLCVIVLISARMGEVWGQGSKVGIVRCEGRNDIGVLIQKAVCEKGFDAIEITDRELADEQGFNRNTYDTVVIVDGESFPVEATGNFMRFVKAGGNVMILGGAFPELAVPREEAFIHVFSKEPEYQLSQVKRVEKAPGQTLIDREVSIEGTFDGVWAIAAEAVGETAFWPVLSCVDRYGRDRGWACGLVVNYGKQSGFYGSQWLLSGIRSEAFYKEKSFLDVLGDLLAKMKDGHLIAKARAEHEKQNSKEFGPGDEQSVAIRLSADGKHFKYADGRACFLTGVNIIGSFGNDFFRGNGFYAEQMEEDFRRAKAAGVNCMRIYGGRWIYKDAKKLTALKACTRKYGIYLLIVVTDLTEYMTRQKLFDQGAHIGESFAGEPMLLGYDLQNEPYFWQLGEIADDDGSKLKERYPFDSHGTYSIKHYFEKALGAYDSDREYGWHGSTFPGITAKSVRNGRLVVNDAYAGAVGDLEGIYGTWIRWLSEGIRSKDNKGALTVGYNTVYELLGCNAVLDFVAHHHYRRPASYADVMEDMSVVDRIHLVWNDRPITVGEFGYPNCEILPDGTYLDMYTSAVGEMMNYLYAFAGGYDGVMKWKLHDRLTADSQRQCKWITYDDLEKHRREGGYGMYMYDGTWGGRAKPIVWSLKFFRGFIDSEVDLRGPAGRGKLEILPGATSIGSVYRYTHCHAMFVGDVAYQSEGLGFSGDRAVNVMLRWDDKHLKIMASGDATVRVRPGTFVKGMTVEEANVSGRYGSLKRESDILVIEMLEGEVLKVR